MSLFVMPRVGTGLYIMALAVSLAAISEASGQTAGGIVMSGDRTFDCDSIATGVVLWLTA